MTRYPTAKPTPPAPRMIPKHKPPASVQADDLGKRTATAMPPTMRGPVVVVGIGVGKKIPKKKT